MPDPIAPRDDPWTDDLFGGDDAPPREPAIPRSTKSFDDFLRETPAAPYEMLMKCALWGAGVLTGLLFAASLARMVM